MDNKKIFWEALFRGLRMLAAGIERYKQYSQMEIGVSELLDTIIEALNMVANGINSAFLRPKV